MVSLTIRQMLRTMVLNYSSCNAHRCLTESPTEAPTPLPTALPFPAPTRRPTPIPTASPTEFPTYSPTPLPSVQPTPLPTIFPTPTPTSAPTVMPTPLTPFPTSLPTTPLPSTPPSPLPTKIPTPLPTKTPTSVPTPLPSLGCESGTTFLHKIQLFSSSGNGWQGIYWFITLNGSKLELSDGVPLSGTLSDGAVGIEYMCLPDDCYELFINESNSAVTWKFEDPDGNKFSGEAPAKDRFCTDNGTLYAHPTPSPTASFPPTPLPSDTPTARPTPLPSRIPTSAPTALPIPVPTALPIPEPTALPVPTPTPLPTPVPTTPQPTTPQPTPQPSGLPVPVPTALPIPNPTHLPVPVPTALPIPNPTQLPNPVPTALPVPAPSSLPVPMPTPLPSPLPTYQPSPLPTYQPTPQPTPLTFAPTTPAPTPKPTYLPSFAPYTTASASSSVSLSGFSSPSDFTDTHKEAFKTSLVSTSSYITSTDMITSCNATANRRRRGLLDSTVSVSFTVELVLEDYNFTSSNSTSSSFATGLVSSLTSELTSALNTTGNSSFLSTFTSVASSYNISVKNISVDVEASVAALVSMAQSVVVTTVQYTHPPTQLPTPVPFPVPTLAPTPTAVPTVEKIEQNFWLSLLQSPVGIVTGVIVVLIGSLAAAIFTWHKFYGQKKVLPDDGLEKIVKEEPELPEGFDKIDLPSLDSPLPFLPRPNDFTMAVEQKSNDPPTSLPSMPRMPVAQKRYWDQGFEEERFKFNLASPVAPLGPLPPLQQGTAMREGDNQGTGSRPPNREIREGWAPHQDT